MLEHLINDGRAVEIIIVLMAIEGLALIVYHRRTSLGPAPADIVAMLLAGLCLMLALRAALTGSGWVWIAIFLSAALFAHLADLRRRWRA